MKKNFWSNIRFSSAFSPHIELKVTHRVREVNLLEKASFKSSIALMRIRRNCLNFDCHHFYVNFCDELYKLEKSCTIANPERSFKTSYVEMNFGMACLSKKQKELFWIWVIFFRFWWGIRTRIYNRKLTKKHSNQWQNIEKVMLSLLVSTTRWKAYALANDNKIVAKPTSKSVFEWRAIILVCVSLLPHFIS